MTYFFIIILIIALFCLVYKIPFINSLPVLMYHSVSKTEKEDLTVLESELEKHFQFLIDNNYQTIFYNEIDKTKKQVLLTFDDGYVNNFNLLVPLLIQFNFKATIFLPFEFIGKKDEWWTNSEDIMAIEVLKELDTQYIQLGWHSYSHQSYKDLLIMDIKNDLIKAKNFIESNNLTVAPIFAYPFGNFPKNKTKQVQLFRLFDEFGFAYAFRIGNRLNIYPFKNKYLIKRIDIRGTDKMLAFRWKMKFGRIKPF